MDFGNIANFNIGSGNVFGSGSFIGGAWDSLYYDSGIHDVWAPYGNSITNLFSGVTTGIANVAKGIGNFINSDNLTLLVLVAGAGVVVYGIVSVYNGGKS